MYEVTHVIERHDDHDGAAKNVEGINSCTGGWECDLIHDEELFEM